MRCFLILNPGSRGGKSSNNFKRILSALDNYNINYAYKITASLEDAYTFSVEANKEGYDVIVAVGGDGTINRVINGFYDASGRKISKAKLAVIYTGTSPDFCKSYQIPIKVKPAVEVLVKGKSREIQIGKITHASIFNKSLDEQPITCLKNNITINYFACCANIGLGAVLARNANSGIRKYIGDYAGTFVSLLKTLLNYKASSFTVSFDGKRKIIDKVYNIGVGRTTFIASGIKVKNNLKHKDQSFYKLLIKNIRFFNLIDIVIKLYSGKEIENTDDFSLEYAKTIEVYGCKENPELEFDGDPRGFLPCLIETAQEPLDLICEVEDE